VARVQQRPSNNSYNKISRTRIAPILGQEACTHTLEYFLDRLLKGKCNGLRGVEMQLVGRASEMTR